MTVNEVKHVLLVEDEPVTSKVFEKILSKQGCEVTAFDDGEAALEMIRIKHFNLYIFDIRTPKLGGMELFRLLQEEQPNYSHNVLFTTGDLLSTSIEKMLKSTNRPYLLKPFTPDELRTAIRNILN